MEHPSLWVREATPLPAEPATWPNTCDVVVIGGGVAGTSAALALARRGVDTTLCEAGHIADRASGRNDGQILLGLGEHYNRIVGQFGAAGARTLWQFIQRNHEDLCAEVESWSENCHLTQAGGLRLAETEHEQAELREAASLLDAEGIPHELLDRDALTGLFPASGGTFLGALRLQGEAVVQPAAMVRGLASAARRAGARVYEQTPVTGIIEAGDKQLVAIADGRQIEATIVVHATSALAPHLDRSGFLGRRVFPFRGQILASDPLSDEIAAGFPADCAMSSNFCYEYFRLHRNGGGARFVVGGMRWSVSGEELGIVDDTTVNTDVSAHLIDWVTKHFAALRDVQFPHTWTGIMAGTDDGLPLVGALPGPPGRFAILAFNGYGMSFAHRTGSVLADLITDGRSDDPAAPLFAPRRFT